MPDGETPDEETPDATPTAVRTPEEERRRRLRAARLLGEVVPATTRDETAEGWGERDASRDEDLRRDVPPHHGG
ncbi:hypothetical protein FE697_011825 [Mumia zhuanghuii]|uniref:Uncharacterized protein n=2 Tax=Mumia TaxID=1546255 RepID=A0ABW1QHZ4_9ACTN|nr:MULTISPECIES: hypothetical protein [Mumia]KAA1422834.1 hypothetical protein FE697_011825 [Mumia zhuanghuii]